MRGAENGERMLGASQDVSCDAALETGVEPVSRSASGLQPPGEEAHPLPLYD